VLAIDGLRVWYGPTEVLRGVTLTVPERAIIALLGGNGSGTRATTNLADALLQVPMRETSCPLQNSRNSRCRRRRAASPPAPRHRP
jgi:ABC-type branched-subunit amino acid transport system ATPase component